MIVVLVELEQGSDGVGEASEVSLETISFARSLSEAGGGVPVDALVIGDLPETVRCDLAAHGVRTVYHADISSYGGGAWASAALAARAASGAVVLTAAGTNRGNEVLAHVAARVEAPMAANVLEFSGLAPFTVTRQVLGGAAREEMVLGMRPAIFSVAGHAVAAEPAATPGEATVVSLDVALSDLDKAGQVVSVEHAEAGDSSGLKDAKVVVGAGRGAGGPDGFGPAIELAELLGGTLGVSRVVTSLGWRPHHEQVGQTGTRISPDLYIACGISGAIQHWAGCATSKTIIAINTDDEAPMVTKANYAVIGDMHEVLPELVARLKT